MFCSRRTPYHVESVGLCSPDLTFSLLLAITELREKKRNKWPKSNWEFQIDSRPPNKRYKRTRRKDSCTIIHVRGSQTTHGSFFISHERYIYIKTGGDGEKLTNTKESHKWICHWTRWTSGGARWWLNESCRKCYWFMQIKLRALLIVRTSNSQKRHTCEGKNKESKKWNGNIKQFQSRYGCWTIDYCS